MRHDPPFSSHRVALGSKRARRDETRRDELPRPRTAERGRFGPLSSVSSARVVDRSDSSSSSSSSGEAAREVGRRDVFPLYARDGSFGARRVHDDACRSVVASSLARRECLVDSDTRSARARDTPARYNALSHPPDSFRTTPQMGWRRTLSLDDIGGGAVPSEDGGRTTPLCRGRRSRSSHLGANVQRSLVRPTHAPLLRFGAAVARGAWCVRKQCVGTKTTLSQAWSGNCIRGPQCAFEMSMFMCPAVHKLTRN